MTIISIETLFGAIASDEEWRDIPRAFVECRRHNEYVPFGGTQNCPERTNNQTTKCILERQQYSVHCIARTFKECTGFSKSYNNEAQDGAGTAGANSSARQAKEGNENVDEWNNDDRTHLYCIFQKYRSKKETWGLIRENILTGKEGVLLTCKKLCRVSLDTTSGIQTLSGTSNFSQSIISQQLDGMYPIYVLIVECFKDSYLQTSIALFLPSNCSVNCTASNNFDWFRKEEGCQSQTTLGSNNSS